MRVLTALFVLSIAIPSATAAEEKCPANFNAKQGVDVKGDQPFAQPIVARARSCNTHIVNGFPVPDPKCTPGAVNPTVTIDVLRAPGFSTDCLRDKATSETEKGKTYLWYNTRIPQNNKGPNQVCELDHLVPLTLGGADTLDNIWPQCGPAGVELSQRYFKRKDGFEETLGQQVRDGALSLEDARQKLDQYRSQFAHDFTKFFAGGEAR